MTRTWLRLLVAVCCAVNSGPFAARSKWLSTTSPLSRATRPAARPSSSVSTAPCELSRPPALPVGECRSSRWRVPPGSAWRGEWACGFCGFPVQLFGVKNPLGEKNRRKNRKNRENLRLESQGWCREDAGRLDRMEAPDKKWPVTRLRPAGYGGQAGCQWGSEPPSPGGQASGMASSKDGKGHLRK